MTSHQAAARVRARLQEMDLQHVRMGLPPISAADMTPQQRAAEVIDRANFASWQDPVDLDVLEAAAAHLLAWICAADEVELGRVETGDAA